ncbi:hypothetical protein [Pseudofrankia asymbiotica]|uniref:Uncharacterized protein n=1 Tax=Pseudofrankia asymbiotica TaxID=1834516 RepID=A0A1V2IEU2_9ACTN|nr:hypothetical protein [Pseudofrankia asymbiotica]ONH31637.1 hypothetical protein BL253_08165 [Pseudofrankia asymbiotica]
MSELGTATDPAAATSNLDDAEALVARSRAELALDPDNRILRDQLAWSLSDRLAPLYFYAGRPDDAAATAREAISITSGLIDDPGGMPPRPLYDRILEVAGFVPAAESIPPTERVVAYYRSLAAADPAADEPSRRLAAVLSQRLAPRLSYAGRPADAAAAQAEGTAILERLDARKTTATTLRDLGFGGDANRRPP